MKTNTTVLAERLKSVVSPLRSAVATSTLSAEAAQEQIEALWPEWRYDVEKYPPLPVNHPWEVQRAISCQGAQDGPQSLAEALLWKLGKWKDYQSCLEMYRGRGTEVRVGRIVHDAFALHLRDPERPVYDQHALRGLVAIDSTLSVDETVVLQRVMFKSAEAESEWARVSNGRNAVQAYNLFVARITAISRHGASLHLLDQLLMPLGKALKQCFRTRSAFEGFLGTLR